MIQELAFESRDGIALEGQLEEPPKPRAGLVFCHPHPQMGGTMKAPLLVAVSDELLGRGWSVLRFNFRGVGGSGGRSGTGIEEVKDALGALDLMREKDLLLALGGWSFGAGVALRAAAAAPDLIACFAIAPAVEGRPGITEPVPGDLDLRAPTLVVVGSNDDQVSPDACRTWAQKAPGTTYVELRGANHFFWGKYDDLSATVADWLDKATGPSVGPGKE